MPGRVDALPPELRSLAPVSAEETAASTARSGVAAGDLTQPGDGWTVRLSDGLRSLAAAVRADLAMDDEVGGERTGLEVR